MSQSKNERVSQNTLLDIYSNQLIINYSVNRSTAINQIIELLSKHDDLAIPLQLIDAMNVEMLFCQKNNSNSYTLISKILETKYNDHILNKWLDLNHYSNITADNTNLLHQFTKGRELFDNFDAAKARLEAIIQFRDQCQNETLKTKINQTIKQFSHNLIIHNTNKIIDDMRKEIDALVVDVDIPKTISANIEELNSLLNTTNKSLSISSGQHEGRSKLNGLNSKKNKDPYETINNLINNIEKSLRDLNSIEKIPNVPVKITKGVKGALNNLIDFINLVFPNTLSNYTADTSQITDNYKNKLHDFKDQMRQMIEKTTPAKENVTTVQRMGGRGK